MSNKNNSVKFDPFLLSKNIITGVFKDKKQKNNKKNKKILKIATIGAPILFTRYLYNYKIKRPLQFNLVITDESRKQMAKKSKKVKKKK